MHGFLVGKMLGVPCVGVAYADKVRSAAERFRNPPVAELHDLVNQAEPLHQVVVREFCVGQSCTVMHGPANWHIGRPNKLLINK